MLIHFERLADSSHPNMAVVTVRTRDGQEELEVSARSIREDMLDVGCLVGRQGDFYLVEMPQETFRGCWRVWVHKSDVRETAEVSA